MRTIAIAALTTALLAPIAAHAECVQERVIPQNDHFGWIRGQPDLNGQSLWRLNQGSEVTYCGRWQNDYRSPPITWYWISFHSIQEPWEHKGWMSSRILEPIVNVNVNVQSSPPPITGRSTSSPQESLAPETSGRVSSISQQQNRNFTVINNTPNTVTKMWLSTFSDDKWFYVTRFDAIGPGETGHINLTHEGPCRVQLRADFNGEDAVTWDDGFNLCEISRIEIYREGGKYHASYK